jgi:hypothetical protein
LEQSFENLQQKKDEVDVTICDARQTSFMETYDEFEKRVVLLSEGHPRMWIYTSPEVDLPHLHADVTPLNAAFDHNYSWEVSLMPEAFLPGG